MKRINININEEILSKLDMYAEKFGVKRNDMINIFLYDGIEYWEKLCKPWPDYIYEYIRKFQG